MFTEMEAPDESERVLRSPLVLLYNLADTVYEAAHGHEMNLARRPLPAGSACKDRRAYEAYLQCGAELLR